MPKHRGLPPRRTGQADFPTSGSPESGSSEACADSGRRPALQVQQPETFELPVVTDPFRRSEGPLTAATEMLRKSLTKVRVDRTESLPRIAEVEVVLPASQVPVDLLYQLRDRLEALPMIGHRVQLGPLPFQGLGRRTHVQIPPPSPLQVVVVAERVSRPAELHRQPLVEPSVRLSPHSAPIRQTCRSSRVASERRDPRAP